MLQLVALCLSAIAGAAVGQTQRVVYSQSASSNLLNPERGFYHPTETFLSAYEELAPELTSTLRTNDITLVFRSYYLDTCLTSDLPASFLQKLSTELALIRTKGMKIIPRFCYTDDQNARAKDPTLAIVLRHIEQIAPILSTNADILFLFQAGFIGVWGEWYYTTNFPVNSPDRERILNALLSGIPASRQIAVRTPAYKQTFLRNTVAISSAAQATDTSKSAARLSLHNDCFLMDSTDSGTYRNDADKTYVSTESTYGISFGGETCKTSTLTNSCATTLSTMQTMHATYMNIAYHPGVISSWKTNGCFSGIKDRLGYRLLAKQGDFSATAAPGGSVSFELSIMNDGFSPPINPRDVEVILQSGARRCVAQITNVYPKAWASGSTFTISASLKLPQTMPLGTYNLLLNLPDPIASIRNQKEYRILFANAETISSIERLNDLRHSVQVTAQAASNADGKTPFNITCP